MIHDSQFLNKKKKEMPFIVPPVPSMYPMPTLYPFFNAFVPPPPQPKQIGKYEFSFQNRLGAGITSEAFVGVNKETSEQVCIKIIDRLKFKNQQQLQLMENEVKCQEKVSSQHTVRIYDIYDTNSFCFIVTELCQGGDLFKELRKSKGGLSDETVVQYAYDIAQGLLKMKENKIIHRDIKSQNILLKNGKAKVGDFGFAIQQENLQEKEQFNLGSPLYMSLQALEQNKYSYSSDVFAYGIVLYELLHAKSPWECDDEAQLINRMKNQEITFSVKVSDELKDLILSCLERQAEERTKIQDIIKHKIFQQFQGQNNSD